MPPVQESSFSIFINAPPEFVFDYLADVRNMSEWSPATEEIELESPGDIRLGSQFRLSWDSGAGKRSFHQVVITDSRRPTHLAFVLHDEYFEDITQEFSLKLLEGGTLVRRRVFTSMGLAHALLARILIAPLVQPLYANSLHSLKQRVETRARQGKRRLH